MEHIAADFHSEGGTLKIHLFGEFRIEHAEYPASGIAGSRIRSILAYLILHAGTHVPRGVLANLCWPETSEAQSRTNLRRELHVFLKKNPQLNGFLETTRQAVIWNHPEHFFVDVGQFETTAKEALDSAKQLSAEPGSITSRVENALDLYTAEMLPDSYDPWIIDKRESLGQLHFDLLLLAAEIADSDTQSGQAIQYCKKCLSIDPLSESANRLLITLHFKAGQFANALKAYSQYAEQLAHELQASPDSSFETLLSDIELALQATATESTLLRPITTPDQLPLKGRNSLLAYLSRCLDNATASKPVFINMTGDSGMGKSRLIEEIAHRAGANWTVAEARCSAVNPAIAFEPITQWLQHPALTPSLESLDQRAGDTLRAAFPEINLVTGSENITVAGNGSRNYLFRVLRVVLQRFSRPLLLILDDAQWCDHDSLDWLTYLLAQPSSSKLVVVAAKRPSPVIDHSLFNRRTVASPQSRHDIELQPLNAEESGELLDSACEHYSVNLDELKRRALLESANGHPFFLIQLLQHETSLSAGTGSVSAGAVSASMDDSLQALVFDRLHALSEETQRVANVLSVLQRAVPTSSLAEILDISEDDLLESISELERCRLVRTGRNNFYVLTHDSIKESILRTMGLKQRVNTHRAVAKVLEARANQSNSADMAEIAFHYLQGKLEQDAYRWFREAALLTGDNDAWHQSVAYTRTALDLISGTQADYADNNELVTLKWHKVVMLSLMHGQAADCIVDDVKELEKLLPRIKQPNTGLKINTLLRIFYMYRGEMNKARTIADRGVAMARKADSEFPLVIALGGRGISNMFGGNHKEAHTSYKESYEIMTRIFTGSEPDKPSKTGFGIFGLYAGTMMYSTSSLFCARQSEAIEAFAFTRQFDISTFHPHGLAKALHGRAWIALLDDSILSFSQVMREFEANKGSIDEVFGKLFYVFFKGYHECMFMGKESALENMKSATADIQALPENYVHNSYHCFLAQCENRLGKVDEAATRLSLVVETDQSSTHACWDAEIWRLLGNYREALGDTAGALEALDSSIDLAGQQGANRFRIRALTNLLEILIKKHATVTAAEPRLRRASNQLTELLTVTEGFGISTDSKKARKMLTLLANSDLLINSSGSTELPMY